MRKNNFKPLQADINTFGNLTDKEIENLSDEELQKIGKFFWRNLPKDRDELIYKLQEKREKIKK